MTQKATISKVSKRRRTRSGGNVMIESVFTLVPLFALIFGITDFGIMLFRWSTLQNAVREGCRYAITFQTKSGLGQDASVKSVVEGYAMGFVKTTDSPAHIFVNYYAPNALTTPISSGGNLPGNIVEVSVQNISFSWLAPLSGSIGWGGSSTLRSTTPLSVATYSADILGGYPVGVTTVAR
ncbi:MAG: TadE family protein [Bryobacteraceae bacterium]